MGEKKPWCCVIGCEVEATTVVSESASDATVDDYTHACDAHVNVLGESYERPCTQPLSC